MGVSKKIINFLEKNKVSFEIVEHKTVFTALDKSKTLHVPPHVVLKTVIAKSKNEFFFLLLPGDKKIDLKKLKKIKKDMKLVGEKVIKKNIKGVMVGAVPPFGSLWGAKTIADRSIKNMKKLIINGGDWNHSIRISSSTLKKLIPDLIFVDIKK